jgi:F-type H+-transporting ATPase subunit gamma
MSQNIEKINRRKENVETINPLLSALRTISLSNWRSSLNRKKSLKSYINQLEGAYKIVKENTNINYPHEISQKKILYIIGSNRGLCGNFNKSIRDLFIRESLSDNDKLEIILIGKRLSQLFIQANILFTNTLDFPDIKNIQDFAIPLSNSAATKFQHSSVSVLYNKYIGASKYITTLQRIYPQEDINLIEKDINSSGIIIDTDPQQLLRAIESILLNSQLQLCLLSSLASESSARFSIMENAGRNVDDLINELKIIIQDHRRGKITTETQELAVSSGLLNSDK